MTNAVKSNSLMVNNTTTSGLGYGLLKFQEISWVYKENSQGKQPYDEGRCEPVLPKCFFDV